MTKICLFILTIIFVSNVFAKYDTIKNPVVPKEIVTGFSKAHPNAKLVNWTKYNNIYIASYRQDNANLWTTYDSKGQLLENKWKVTAVNLPAATQDYIKKNNTQGIQEYYKIIDAAGTINYEVSSFAKSYIFNSEGEHYKTVELLKK
jgi:hypothetical protein